MEPTDPYKESTGDPTLEVTDQPESNGIGKLVLMNRLWVHALRTVGHQMRKQNEELCCSESMLYAIGNSLVLIRLSS